MTSSAISKPRRNSIVMEPNLGAAARRRNKVKDVDNLKKDTSAGSIGTSATSSTTASNSTSSRVSSVKPFPSFQKTKLKADPVKTFGIADSFDHSAQGTPLSRTPRSKKKKTIKPLRSRSAEPKPPKQIVVDFPSGGGIPGDSSEFVSSPSESLISANDKMTRILLKQKNVVGEEKDSSTPQSPSVFKATTDAINQFAMMVDSKTAFFEKSTEVQEPSANNESTPCVSKISLAKSCSTLGGEEVTAESFAEQATARSSKFKNAKQKLKTLPASLPTKKQEKNESNSSAKIATRSWRRLKTANHAPEIGHGDGPEPPSSGQEVSLEGFASTSAASAKKIDSKTSLSAKVAAKSSAHQEKSKKSSAVMDIRLETTPSKAQAANKTEKGVVKQEIISKGQSTPEKKDQSPRYSNPIGKRWSMTKSKSSSDLLETTSVSKSISSAEKKTMANPSASLVETNKVGAEGSSPAGNKETKKTSNLKTQRSKLNQRKLPMKKPSRSKQLSVSNVEVNQDSKVDKPQQQQDLSYSAGKETETTENEIQPAKPPASDTHKKQSTLKQKLDKALVAKKSLQSSLSVEENEGATVSSSCHASGGVLSREQDKGVENERESTAGLNHAIAADGADNKKVVPVATLKSLEEFQPENKPVDAEKGTEGQKTLFGETINESKKKKPMQTQQHTKPSEPEGNVLLRTDPDGNVLQRTDPEAPLFSSQNNKSKNAEETDVGNQEPPTPGQSGGNNAPPEFEVVLNKETKRPNAAPAGMPKGTETPTEDPPSQQQKAPAEIRASIPSNQKTHFSSTIPENIVFPASSQDSFNKLFEDSPKALAASPGQQKTVPTSSHKAAIDANANKNQTKGCDDMPPPPPPPMPPQTIPDVVLAKRKGKRRSKQREKHLSSRKGVEAEDAVKDDQSALLEVGSHHSAESLNFFVCGDDGSTGFADTDGEGQRAVAMKGRRRSFVKNISTMIGKSGVVPRIRTDMTTPRGDGNVPEELLSDDSLASPSGDNVKFSDVPSSFLCGMELANRAPGDLKHHFGDFKIGPTSSSEDEDNLSKSTTELKSVNSQEPERRQPKQKSTRRKREADGFSEEDTDIESDTESAAGFGPEEVKRWLEEEATFQRLKSGISAFSPNFFADQGGDKMINEWSVSRMSGSVIDYVFGGTQKGKQDVTGSIKSDRETVEVDDKTH